MGCGPWIRSAGARSDSYTYTISGAIAADGSYSNVTGTGGVVGAYGRFLDAPTCVTVPPAPADLCKRGGWENHADGPFKNQGQCVSFHARNE